MPFTPNPRFERDLFAVHELTDLVEAAGERALDEARRTAEAEGRTGEFADSLEIRNHRSRTRRPISTVFSTDPGALSIEFGTETTPRHRFLGRALDAIRRRS